MMIDWKARTIARKLKRKALLGVFKLKRASDRFLGEKRLDYKKRCIYLKISTLREFETRAESCRKEPGTIAWIEKNAPSFSVMYDIGANVGAYSLVAAANGLRVIAFEPAYQNFCALQRNVTLNGFDSSITCLPTALSSETKLAAFTYLDSSPGSSRGYYNEQGQFHLPAAAPETEKQTLVYSLDDLIRTFRLPHPQMIKIDVDGGEYDVVMGAKNTLSDPLLTTVLMEVTEKFERERNAVDVVRSLGFEEVEVHTLDQETTNRVFRRRSISP